MLTFVMTAGLASAAICSVIGRYVATAKGRSRTEGTLLGALLGPIGVLVVALLPDGPGEGAPKPRPAITRDRDDVEGFDLRKVIEDPRGPR